MVAEVSTHGVRRAPNAIGALRLLFASLVIISHSVEMLDGDLRREPLHMLFGTMSLGGAAVDAFFLLSGYLIASSFASSTSVGAYVWKRVLRIVPAFVVCSVVCVFVVAPLAGAKLSNLAAGDWGRIVYRMAMLKSPEVEGIFAGLPYPALNGSAWTIAYEFRCYILAGLFGLVGLYRRRALYALLTCGVLIASVLASWPVAPVTAAPNWLVAVFGEPRENLRLLSAFMVGTCFWLYQDALPLRRSYALLAGALLFGLLFSPHLAEAALVLLGGYILFCLAFNTRSRHLLSLNSENDISYGVYLYAWPLGALLVWYWRTIPPTTLGIMTLAGAVICGALSWFVVERPAINARSRLKSPAFRDQAPAVSRPEDARPPDAGLAPEA